MDINVNTRLAAVYNIFDGEENLQSSIQSVREAVDVVIVVQQQTSNFGNEHKRNLKSFLKTIKEIDLLLDYEPDVFSIPGKNEFNKRILGLKKAVEIGCTHYLHMDCDEEYNSVQFKKAFNIILENDYDSSACRLLNYYKFRDLRIEQVLHLYVPFIHKIQKGIMRMNLENKYPVLVDKTRKGNPINNFHLFEKKDIYMHHYSWVRDDIVQKINNSTARHVFEPVKKEIIKSFDNFERNQKLIRAKIGQNFLIAPESILNGVKFSNYEFLETKIIK